MSKMKNGRKEEKNIDYVKKEKKEMNISNRSLNTRFFDSNIKKRL